MKNLKKIFGYLVLSSIFFSGAFALSDGNEYITLKEPIPNAQNSVYEIWSYRCSHCYDHYKFGTMEKIAKAIPDAKLGYLIVKTMGDYGKEAAEILAYAQNEDEKAGRSVVAKDSLYHKVSEAYFKAYFKKKQRWGNGAEPDKFYAVGLNVLGIDKAKLDEFVASDEGKKLIEACDVADSISKNFGTPGFVVNGKYEVNMAKVPSPDALIKIIEELLKM